MYETSTQRINALKSGIEPPVIEQIYLETNSIKVVRYNILKTGKDNPCQTHLK